MTTDSDAKLVFQEKQWGLIIIEEYREVHYSSLSMSVVFEIFHTTVDIIYSERVI